MHDFSPKVTPESILIVCGTRPEAIKLVPIITQLRESETLVPIVVSTGQHHRLVNEVFELAGITPDIELWAGGPQPRLNNLVASVMRRFEDAIVTTFGESAGGMAALPDVLSGKYPAAALVHGDTSSAMAAALAAFHLRIPVMHVEAGLRTGGLNLTPFPEELNRRLISRVACFHFAPTVTNSQNLIRESVPEEQVFVTGNTGIDALHWAANHDVPYPDERLAALTERDEHDGRMVVVTAHRRESWSTGLAGVAQGVRLLAERFPDVTFVIPLHPNPRVQDQLGAPLKGIPNVLLVDPLPYAPFARLLRRCDIVLTDSGGIQEEAPSLGKPVVVLRDTTERVEGVEAGTLVLAGTDPDRIVAATSRLLSNRAAYERVAGAINPYGDGQAAKRICAALQHLRGHGTPPHPYGPGYRRDFVLQAAGYVEGLKPGLLAHHQRGETLEDFPEHHAEVTWPS